jgi:hypothetical protein
MERRRTVFAGNLLPLVPLFLVVLLPSPAAPQTIPSQQDLNPDQVERRENPPGVSFTLRIKDGRTKFRQGELITIEMLFASSLPNTYRLDARTYDRSGRLWADTYHVEPEAGAGDPLNDYLQSGMFGGGMGGLSPMPPTLGEKAYVVAQDLNEFVRFDKPGEYRFWVTNNRIGTIDPSNRFKSKEELAATSNTVEIEILAADSGWQKLKIQDAKVILDSVKPTDRRAACRALRFLSSEDAEIEMIRRYRGSADGCDGEFHFGLLSSPRRESVIREMEAQIAAPEHPVTVSFIQTLGTLAYLSQFRVPMLPYPNGNEEKMKPWQAEMQKRRAAFQEITANYREQLLEAVSRKEKSALAVSLGTLLEFEVNVPNEKRTPARTARVDQIAAALPGIFLNLPSDTQSRMLTYFWKPIANPSMLPALQRLIDKPSSPEEGTFSDLRGIALKRLFELAPDEGRQAVLREIRRTPLRIRPQALSILPDETLPELDEILSEKLSRHDPETEFDVVADYSALIARYATSASLPAVKKALANKVGRMACHIQSPMIAFSLRVDPDYGVEVLEQSLTARKETGCYRSEFGEVARFYPSPRLEGIAAAHLDDPEVIVAVQAAAVLGQYGSAKAEQHLMDRLERWHTQWSGREKEIQAPNEKGMVDGDPTQLEIELVRALVRARAWVVDYETLNRIRQLCLTVSGRNEVDSAIRDAKDLSIRVTFNSVDNSPEHFSVGQYRPETVKHLKEKLIQFSKGTVFVWKPQNDGGTSEEQLFSELKKLLTQHDLKLEKPDK